MVVVKAGLMEVGCSEKKNEVDKKNEVEKNHKGMGMGTVMEEVVCSMAVVEKGAEEGKVLAGW